MIRLVLPKRRILLGDVHFEIDVIDARHDRLTQKLLSLVLLAAPEAPVGAPPNREDHRRRALLEYPLQIGVPAQTVDPQLDQVHPGLGRLFHSSAREECRPRPIVTQIISAYPPPRRDLSRPAPSTTRQTFPALKQFYDNAALP